MKNIKKNLIAMLLGMTASACMVTGGVFAFSQGSIAKADGSLETEFTNNGQFVLSHYDNNEAYVYNVVDSAEEGMPAGATGSVIKMPTSTGAPYINIDFTASKINAKFVESVVARVCAPGYNAAEGDELRIDNISGSLGGAGAYDLSTWCDVELPLNLITGADGNLGSFAFGMRDKLELSTYFYIDSITVNMKETKAVTFTGINLYWNHSEFRDSYCSILEFSGGIEVGNLDGDYSDVLAKATLNGEPVDSTNLSFICRAWVDGTGDSTIMRWVTSPEAGSILYIPAGAIFTNGGEDTNIYTLAEDICLKFNGTAWIPYGTYGTPTFGPTKDTYVGAYGWNHNTENVAVIKDTNYGYTIVADWRLAEAKADNLAATDNLTSRSITLNGKSFYELYQEDDGYRLNALLEGYFGFSVPTAALVASNGYDDPTLEIAEGTPFYDGNYLPETTLIFKDGAWQLGADYTPSFKAVGDLNNVYEDGLDAYGLSLKYNTLGFTTPANQVMAEQWSGFTLNDESQSVALFGENQLLFWMGKDKCEAGYNGFSHATLRIAEGAKIVNAEGKVYTFKALTLYLVDGAWTTEVPADYVSPATLAYSGIPNIWNNYKTHDVVSTILMFGTHGVDIFAAEPNADNLANPAYGAPIATAMTINGKTIAEWFAMDSRVSVSYAHGHNYLYIGLPEYLLAAGDNGYTTLKIEDRTKFYNVLLPEFTMYCYNGQWSTEKPVLVNGEDTDYVTVSNLAGQAELTLDNTGVEGVLPTNGSLVYNFLMKNDIENNLVTFSTHYTTTEDGIKFVFMGDEATGTEMITLFVNGTEVASKTIGWTVDDWNAVRVAVTVGDTVSVSLAIDGVYVITVDGLTAELGYKVAMNSSAGVATFADYKTGDIKKPVLYWYGQEEYIVDVKDGVPSDEFFKVYMNAGDVNDGAIANTEAQIVWQDGAIVDGQLQVGTWTVTISVTDNAGNTASKAITVIAEGAVKVLVTFDGVESDKEYYVGDLLEEPETPVKEGDKTTAYEFDGWYVGETKWDFANDVVTGDVELTAKFIEVTLKYTVTIISEGLAQNYSESYKLGYGKTLATDSFAREGYTYKIYAGDTEVNSIVAGEITDYKVVYTAIVVEPEEPTDSSDSSDSTDSDVSSEPTDSDVSSTPDTSIESEAPADSDSSETPSEPQTSTPAEEKGGCGSVVATSVVSVVTLAGAAMLLKKKKED